VRARCGNCTATHGDEPEGYFESPEAAIEYMSSEHDDAPAVITKDDR
jgi:hypothetical protein